MVIERFTHADIVPFLRYAAAENWVSTEWELQFFLDNFPEGCFTCRIDGLPIAFVTSMKYDNSGWIGNLLVGKAMRGKGVGSILMSRALEALRKAGAATVWLTASPDGKPIYERLGFRDIDEIHRWQGKGRRKGKTVCRVADSCREISVEEAIYLDSLGWGDKRSSLVKGSCGRGEIFGGKGAFLVLQDCGSLVQAGPWACTGDDSTASLFDTAMSYLGTSRQIVLDVPGGNSAGALLLASRGFARIGKTCLMYYGVRPAYDPLKIYALGSMGSMG